MTLMPEADIDYEAVEKAEVGELVYSKTGLFKKAKWVIKTKDGKSYIFDNFDSGLLAELMLKCLAQEKSEQGDKDLK